MPTVQNSQPIFKFKDRLIRHGDPTLICGIVNVTPDSFSDGGKWFGVEEAYKRAIQLIQEGCQMIDIGGESTRPGSTYVEVEEEIRRVVPVIKALRAESDVIISVDTWKSEVAQAAIDAGADIINDITGLLGDPRMASVIAPTSAGVIVMANPVIVRPDHPSAKVFPQFGAHGVFSPKELEAFKKMDAVELIDKYFDKSLEYAQAAGIASERITLDPGIGFGLTKRENYELIHQSQRIHQRGFTCFLGVSRKRFIQNTLNEAGYSVDVATEEGFRQRDAASAALSAIAAFMGIEMLRVHVGEPHHIAALIGNNLRLSNTLDDTHFAAYPIK
ncbi:dihydropteroate synthase [Facklamia miroungae]|uniref:Dihydropteroate synthase n=1 Tax=Facklamia miroungae TaxID=120956 RepID=A0A1G7PST6_9LACT|nr:dihydropteroate synthase [Facklamia miroungae]NKZ28815.1 dihydropteroate synthase [Facklamia miroungae]SDF89294.1 dihydropteroate synthase [Facklamia miroungae]